MKVSRVHFAVICSIHRDGNDVMLHCTVAYYTTLYVTYVYTTQHTFTFNAFAERSAVALVWGHLLFETM